MPQQRVFSTFLENGNGQSTTCKQFSVCLYVCEHRENGRAAIMGLRKMKFIIDSDLDNIPLIGISINKLCSLIPFSERMALQVELCVVEAVTNCIKHAYKYDSAQKVGVGFTLSPEELVLDIYDTGIPLEMEMLDRADFKSLEVDPEDLENIAEGGRGLPIIKEVMDSVVYESEKGMNCLTMKKKLAS